MGSIVWSGAIVIADMSIAVKLQVAAKTESIALTQLHRRDLSRVSQEVFCQAEKKAVNRNEVGLGYEYAEGQYVLVEDHEIKAVAPESTKRVRIGGCVSLSEVDPLLYLDSYFVQPADAIAEVEYTALYSALRDSKRALIGKISMYRRESLAAVRAGHSGIILHTLFYAHEVRRVDEFRTDLAIMDSDAGKSAARRIRSAVRKLGQGADVENQTDGYRAAIVAMIRQKVDGNHSGFLVTTASPSDGAGPS